MSQIEKNTVKAENQLKPRFRITFDNESGKGRRILFVGNSITRHAPKPDIGWYDDWGMAATAREKDYVHLTEKAVSDIDPDAVFCICQSADWELNFTEGSKVWDFFEPARNFGADIIVMRLIENCKIDKYEKSGFKKEYTGFVNYLKGSTDAKIIITSGFWKHPGDEALEEIASELGADFVYLGDLGELPEMRADGLFEHEGVAMHPGDGGMRVISERITEMIKKYI